MFLSNWLMVSRVVAASVVEAVDYPTPEEFFLAFDGTNQLFAYGGSKSHASNVAIYFEDYKHEMGNAYPVTLSEPGDYKALVDVCGTRYLTAATTVPATKAATSAESTLAFHHGDFGASDYSNAYATVAAAATNGHVYADTPTGTYDWGTLDSVTTRTLANTTPFSVVDIIQSPVYTGYQGWDTYYYQYDSVNGDVYRYILKYSNGNDVAAGGADYSIDYNRSTGLWSDGGVSSPVTVTHTGTTVTGIQASATLFTFDDPYEKILGTGYTWTPVTGMTANVLMVAGGGGGGAQIGGGGGAGGLLFNQSVTLSGQKTIVVGNSGSGATNVDNASLVGDNGSNTHFTNLTSVVGGGGGASYYVHTAGNDGGSGGGGGAGGSNTGGAGTSSQGFAGGTGLNTNWAGGGGGGAMAVGSNASANTGGAGGVGKELSTVFGSTYGDNGYFAGGGGGGGQSTGGGGGVGGGADGSRNGVIPTNAIKHTGGGGGGSRNTGGSNAGSGVVIIKQTS
jgi:hypothetical protein